jgi:hypothetical protein
VRTPSPNRVRGGIPGKLSVVGNSTFVAGSSEYDLDRLKAGLNLFHSLTYSEESARTLRFMVEIMPTVTAINAAAPNTYFLLGVGSVSGS